MWCDGLPNCTPCFAARPETTSCFLAWATPPAEQVRYHGNFCTTANVAGAAQLLAEHELWNFSKTPFFMISGAAKCHRDVTMTQPHGRIDHPRHLATAAAPSRLHTLPSLAVLGQIRRLVIISPPTPRAAVRSSRRIVTTTRSESGHGCLVRRRAFSRLRSRRLRAGDTGACRSDRSRSAISRTACLVEDALSGQTRRLRHARRDRPTHLCGQGKIVASAIAQLLPREQPVAQIRPHPARFAGDRLGGLLARIRGARARAAVNAALAAALQCAGAAVETPPGFFVLGPRAGALCLFDAPASR